MDKNLHDIDKLFLDALEGQEDQPSGMVWESIDHGLDKKNIVITKRKYNNLKFLSAALLLLLATSVFYTVYIKKYATRTTKTDSLAGVKHDQQKSSGSNVIEEERKANTPDLKQAPNNNSQKTNSDASITGAPGLTGKRNDPSPSAINKKDITTEENIQFTPATDKKITNTVDVVKNNPSHFLKPGFEKNRDLSINKRSFYSANNLSRIQKMESSSISHGQANEEGNTITATQKKKIAANNKITIEKPTIQRELQYSQVSEIDHQNTARLIRGIEIKNNSGGRFTASKIVVAKRRNRFHFSLMPYYSPQINFDRIVEDKEHNRSGGPGLGNDHDDIKKDESQKNAASFGIAVEIPLHKKWSIQTGLFYLNRNIAVQPKKIFAQKDNDGTVKYRMDLSSGYTYLGPKTGGTPVVGDSINTVSSSNHLQYIGLPLTLQYTISWGKFNVLPGLGAVLNYRAGQNFSTNLISPSTNERHNVNNFQGNTKFYVNAVSQIAFQYNVGKRISIDLIPALNVALTSINKASVVKSYPNSFSLATGIKIHF
jgi:hypothetical protein